MINHAIYTIVPAAAHPPGLPPQCVLILDVGHNLGFPTITNDVESVVTRLHSAGATTEPTHRLFYIDSSGNIDEILHDGAGRFIGIAAPFGLQSIPKDSPLADHVRSIYTPEDQPEIYKTDGSRVLHNFEDEEDPGVGGIVDDLYTGGQE